MEKTVENNIVYLVGKVLTEPIFNHKTYGKTYYMICIGVLRKSGYEDKLRIIIPDSDLDARSPIKGEYLEVWGQIRTYNKVVGQKNTLEVIIFAKSIEYIHDYHADMWVNQIRYENVAEFEGFICKKPIKRTSPLGRQICDLMIAVNRQHNKSDYIPTVAWGRVASFCESLAVGEKVNVCGRIQSREYRKFVDEEHIITKTAYEVSATKIEVVNLYE